MGEMVRNEMAADDIAHGKRGDCSRCPVARAIIRAFDVEFVDQVMVDEETISVGHRSVDTPSEVAQFITTFDMGLPVMPIVFELPASLADGLKESS